MPSPRPSCPPSTLDILGYKPSWSIFEKTLVYLSFFSTWHISFKPPTMTLNPILVQTCKCKIQFLFKENQPSTNLPYISIMWMNEWIKYHITLTCVWSCKGAILNTKLPQSDWFYGSQVSLWHNEKVGVVRIVCL